MYSDYTVEENYRFYIAGTSSCYDAIFEDEEPQPRIWLGDYVEQAEYDEALKTLGRYEADSEFGAAVRAAKIIAEVAFGGGAESSEITWAVDELVRFSQKYDDENWIEPLSLDWDDVIGDWKTTAMMIVVYTASIVEDEITSRAA